MSAKTQARPAKHPKMWSIIYRARQGVANDTVYDYVMWHQKLNASEAAVVLLPTSWPSVLSAAAGTLVLLVFVSRS